MISMVLRGICLRVCVLTLEYVVHSSMHQTYACDLFILLAFVLN